MNEQPEFDWKGLTESEKRPSTRQMLASKKIYPIAKVCPTCGAAEYEPIRPDKVFAFASDRGCKSCQTRYTPPTPLWAAAIMLLVGIGLAAGSAVAVAMHVQSGKGFTIPTAAVEAVLGLLGIVVFVEGVRSLLRRGRA